MRPFQVFLLIFLLVTEGLQCFILVSKGGLRKSTHSLSSSSEVPIPVVDVPELRRMIEAESDEEKEGSSFQKRASHLKKSTFAIEFSVGKGEKTTFVKRRGESILHVLMKAMLFASYKDAYPTLEVERDIRDRYTPDLIATDELGDHLFWGECGKTDLKKIYSIAHRFPDTQLAVAKWNVKLQGYAPTVRRTLQGPPAGRGNVILYSFPDDSFERYFTDDGEVLIPHKDDAIQRVSVRAYSKICI